MLGKLDDLLWHQIPTTFDHVGTSDPRFFDRYWFALYDPAGARAIQFTLAAYNNLNVMDGGVAVVHGSQQMNLRTSRALRPTFEPQCGPLAVELIEPMHRLGLRIAANDHGISGEMEFESIAPPEEEAPHFHRQGGRVVENYVRFNQIGRATGQVRLGDLTISLDDWWACRDHSWGVRPDVGGIKEAQKDRVESVRTRNFAFCFLFFSTGNYTGHVQLRIDGDAGDYSTATIRDLRSGEILPAGDFRLSVELVPGTRIFRAIEIQLARDGESGLSLTIEPIAKAIVMPGLGYSGGWNDRRGLGAWRGAAVTEGETWNIDDPLKVVTELGKTWEPLHRIYPVSVVASDGSAGTGSLTWLVTGETPARMQSIKGKH